MTKLFTACFVVSMCFCTALQSCSSNASANNMKKSADKIATVVASKEDEKKAIKEAAIKFYKWMGDVWQKPIGWKKRNKFIDQVFLDKHGKIPTDQENPECPCKLNEKVAANFFSWIRKVAPIISEHYIRSSQQAMREAMKNYNEDNNREEGWAFDHTEYLVVNGMFHIIYGQDSPDFGQSNVLSPKAVWDIRQTTDSTATVNTTFRTGKEWNKGEVIAYKIYMIKEKETWKLQRGMDEGTVNPSFK